MTRFVLHKLAMLIPVVWGVVTIVFALIHLIPGDPVELMLGEQALAAQKDALREQLGLNQPLFQQYVHYLWGLLHFDFGTSIFTREPVVERLASLYPATLQLAVVSMVVAAFISIPLGVIAAVRRGTLVDSSSMLFSMIGISMPNFWLGPMLILLFAYKFDLFPISGRESPLSIVLPAITLGTALAAILSRMTRATLLDVLGQEYMRVARAKGLRSFVVYFKHALKNAAIPVITIMGLQFGALLAGAVITEKIFSWPGLGLEIVESIQRRDYPMVQGCVLAISMSYVLVNLATDLCYAWVDPRVRTRRA